MWKWINESWLFNHCNCNNWNKSDSLVVCGSPGYSGMSLTFPCQLLLSFWCYSGLEQLMTLLFSTCWRGLLYTENIWNQLSCADGNTQQSCKRSNRTTVPSIVTEGKYSSVKCFNDREQRVSSWIVMTTFSWQGLSAFLLLMAARCDFIFYFFIWGRALSEANHFLAEAGVPLPGDCGRRKKHFDSFSSLA